MQRWLVLLFVLVMASSALPVLAQGADESMDAEAHALFEAGRTAFAAGRFSDALGHFQSAYQLSHRAALLYNIGQCQDRLRHDAEALASFEGFVAAVPDSPQRAEVEARIAILRESVSHAATTTTETIPDTSAETSAETVTPEPEPEPEPTPAPVAASHDAGPGPWIVLGVGGVVAVVGAVMVGVAFADIATVQNAMVGTDFSTVRGAYEQAPILSGIGWAALGVGAAMAIGGIVWGIALSSSSSDAHAQLRLGPTGLSLTGAF